MLSPRLSAKKFSASEKSLPCASAKLSSVEGGKMAPDVSTIFIIKKQPYLHKPSFGDKKLQNFPRLSHFHEHDGRAIACEPLL